MWNLFRSFQDGGNASGGRLFDGPLKACFHDESYTPTLPPLRHRALASDSIAVREDFESIHVAVADQGINLEIAPWRCARCSAHASGGGHDQGAGVGLVPPGDADRQVKGP